MFSYKSILKSTSPHYPCSWTASILLDGEVIKVHEEATAPGLHGDVPGEGETGILELLTQFRRSYLAVTASQIQHHLGSTLSSKVLRTLEG